MAKIRKIKEKELIGGTSDTEVYPITHARAVYGKNNTPLSDTLEFLNTEIVWNNSGTLSNMNDFVIAGVYNIKGERTRINDNLPILNTGGGHSFNARLTVLDSSITGDGKNDDKCITQVLSFSNRLGQGDVYIRTGKGSSLDNLTWEKWSTLQRNVNVEQVNTLDDLIDNGIYSGVLIPTGETFVLVVINNYAFASKHGTQKCISQFKYSVSPFGAISFGKRVKIGNADFPAEWDILNRNEIDEMLKNAVAQAIATVVDEAPETFDTLKEIADWIANDETGAVALANATKANAAAITAERTRAIGQEGLLNNAIVGEKDRAEQVEQTIDLKLQDLLSNIDEEARRATQAEGEINQNTIAADSLGYSTTTDDISLEFETLDGKSHGGVTFPAATTEKAGVMSAGDKKALDNVPNTINNAISEEAKATDEKIAKEKVRAEQAEQALANDIANAPNLALRALYVAAGAEYNDSGADKTKTAPWGETVTHKAGHYYLNGLGDITEEQMIAIYNAGIFKGTANYYAGYNDIRTFLPAKISGQEGYGAFQIKGAFAACKNIEVVHFTSERNLTGQYGVSIESPPNISNAFNSCNNLKYIQAIALKANTTATGAFGGCRKLVWIKLFNLAINLSLASSSKISKESIRFIIQKAKPTSAIAITLHADAYARLANDADIVAALEAQPLVTLVSA